MTKFIFLLISFGPGHGVSWPVFTADTPIEVLKYQDENWHFTPLRDRSAMPHTVKTIDIGEYPDVICLKFKNGGQTCFDTMEITER